MLTGEGRFFSAGADVKALGATPQEAYSTNAEKKVAWVGRFVPGRFLKLPSESDFEFSMGTATWSDRVPGIAGSTQVVGYSDALQTYRVRLMA